jgi:SAM-dependent methyltransferase
VSTGLTFMSTPTGYRWLRLARRSSVVRMSNPDWFPDERAHAGPEHLDAAYMATYDRKAAVDPTADVALLRGLGLAAESTVVDLGCGTGAFVLAVAPFCRRVVGVDVSPTMLDALQEKATAFRNVECVRAGFLTYHHRGEPADYVYSRNALHHLPDFWKAVALGRIRDVLRPGGVLRFRDIVYSFDPDQADEIVKAWLDGAADRPEHGWTRAELATHLREEHSTFAWLLEPMLERAGFEIRDVEHAESGVFSAYTCAKT